jgi:hypothetical protein
MLQIQVISVSPIVLVHLYRGPSFAYRSSVVQNYATQKHQIMGFAAGKI